jgi:hypothetical protein
MRSKEKKDFFCQSSTAFFLVFRFSNDEMAQPLTSTERDEVEHKFMQHEQQFSGSGLVSRVF